MDLERLLELVRRELNSDDARFEYGGRPRTDPCCISADLPGGWRVVALYETPSAKPADKQAKLDHLAESFAGVASRLADQVPQPTMAVASQELDYALGVLADKAQAIRALVIDEDSPVLWGSSEAPRGREDVETCLWVAEAAESAIAAGVDLADLVMLDESGTRERLAGLESVSRPESRKVRDRLLRRLSTIRELGPGRDGAAWRHHFVVCRTIAAIRRAPDRHHVVEPGIAWLSREFGGIYHVVLVYTGEFNELAVTGLLMRAAPAIENLVLALPPIEPAPKGGRVIQLVPRGW